MCELALQTQRGFCCSAVKSTDRVYFETVEEVACLSGQENCRAFAHSILNQLASEDGMQRGACTSQLKNLGNFTHGHSDGELNRIR